MMLDIHIGYVGYPYWVSWMLDSWTSLFGKLDSWTSIFGKLDVGQLDSWTHIG